MSKIDFSKECPLTHKGVIEMLRAKLRILTPHPSYPTPSSSSPAKTTPRFNSTLAKTPELFKQNKRITRMYKQNKRAKSALPSAFSNDSPRNTSRTKGYSIYSIYIVFLNFY